MPRLLEEMESWRKGNPFEQRAVAAGLAEPALLNNVDHNLRILRILDQITASVSRSQDRRSDAFRALCQALGYCWSVVVVASPEAGKPLMEQWMANPDPDIRWIMKENLKKKRLAMMDPAWRQELQSRLESRRD